MLLCRVKRLFSTCNGERVNQWLGWGSSEHPDPRVEEGQVNLKGFLSFFCWHILKITNFNLQFRGWVSLYKGSHSGVLPLCDLMHNYRKSETLACIIDNIDYELDNSSDAAYLVWTSAGYFFLCSKIPLQKETGRLLMIHFWPDLK